VARSGYVSLCRLSQHERLYNYIFCWDKYVYHCLTYSHLPNISPSAHSAWAVLCAGFVRQKKAEEDATFCLVHIWWHLLHSLLSNELITGWKNILLKIRDYWKRSTIFVDFSIENASNRVDTKFR
jgi:hypothetical protein